MINLWAAILSFVRSIGRSALQHKWSAQDNRRHQQRITELDIINQNYETECKQAERLYQSASACVIWVNTDQLSLLQRQIEYAVPLSYDKNSEIGIFRGCDVKLIPDPPEPVPPPEPPGYVTVWR